MINLIRQAQAPEKWFVYPESPDEKYLLRFIPYSSLPPCKDKDGNNDPVAFDEQAFQRAVIDWVGVIGDNDEPILCNDETRLLFVHERSGMGQKRKKWVFDIVFSESNFSDADSVLKNSPAPSHGALTSQRQLHAVA